MKSQLIVPGQKPAQPAATMQVGWDGTEVILQLQTILRMNPGDVRKLTAALIYACEQAEAVQAIASNPTTSYGDSQSF
jgi:hypothetical protein